MVELEFGINRMRTWIHHALLPLCRLVVVVQSVGDIFFAHIRPIGHRLKATPYLSIDSDGMSISLRPPCTHPLMATSSRIMHHVTKLESFQIGFLKMSMSSLY